MNPSHLRVVVLCSCCRFVDFHFSTTAFPEAVKVSQQHRVCFVCFGGESKWTLQIEQTVCFCSSAAFLEHTHDGTHSTHISRARGQRGYTSIEGRPKRNRKQIQNFCPGRLRQKRLWDCRSSTYRRLYLVRLSKIVEVTQLNVAASITKKTGISTKRLQLPRKRTSVSLRMGCVYEK